METPKKSIEGNMRNEIPLPKTAPAKQHIKNWKDEVELERRRKDFGT
jgi:hypothetical protein